MTRDRAILLAGVAAGVLLLVIALVYWAEPARSIPGVFPGHEAGSDHRHVKHGLAAFLLALGAFALAWFHAGPRHARPVAS